jgi:flagellar hook-associated protein 3 FlgL
MRITQRSVVLTSLTGLNGNLAAVNRLQQQLSSGKRISQPSDDPTGTNTALLTRQSQAGNAQQARNISDGRTFLDATDSALQTMLDQVRRVRNLTVQALNGGAQNADSQADIATEVTGIRDSLLGQANQVVQGRALFAGVTSGSQAYDPTTGAYTGVGGANGIPVQPLTRRVSDVEAIRVDITGPEAFGDPATGKDLFGVVKNIAAHVGDPTALSTDLADLDAVTAQMTTAAADVGTRSARLDDAATQNSSQALNLSAKLSDTEDIDMAKTIMNLQVQQNAYQAALSATAKSISPSLADFLR